MVKNIISGTKDSNGTSSVIIGWALRHLSWETSNSLEIKRGSHTLSPGTVWHHGQSLWRGGGVWGPPHDITLAHSEVELQLRGSGQFSRICASSTNGQTLAHPCKKTQQLLLNTFELTPVWIFFRSRCECMHGFDNWCSKPEQLTLDRTCKIELCVYFAVSHKYRLSSKRPSGLSGLWSSAGVGVCGFRCLLAPLCEAHSDIPSHGQEQSFHIMVKS